MPRLHPSSSAYRKSSEGIYKVPILAFDSNEAMSWVTAKTADSLLKAELVTLVCRDPYQIRLNADRQTYAWSASTITFEDILAHVGLIDDPKEPGAARRKIGAWETTGDAKAPQILRRCVGLGYCFDQPELPNSVTVREEMGVVYGEA